MEDLRGVKYPITSSSPVLGKYISEYTHAAFACFKNVCMASYENLMKLVKSADHVAFQSAYRLESKIAIINTTCTFYRKKVHY